MYMFVCLSLKKKIFHSHGVQGRFAWGSSNETQILRIIEINLLKREGGKSSKKWEEKRASDKRQHGQLNDREKKGEEKT